MTETQQAITDEPETSDIMLKNITRGVVFVAWVVVNVLILIVGLLCWKFVLVA